MKSESLPYGDDGQFFLSVTHGTVGAEISLPDGHFPSTTVLQDPSNVQLTLRAPVSATSVAVFSARESSTANFMTIQRAVAKNLVGQTA